MASGFFKAELSICRHGRPQVTCRLLYKSVLLLVFGVILWKWMNGVDSLGSNQECRIGYKYYHCRVSQCLASIRRLGNQRSSQGLRSSKGKDLFIFIILAGDIEMNPGFNVPYAKSTVMDRLLECEECEKRFHASCSNLGDNELLRIESGDGAWYCTNSKADCSLCSGVVLKGNQAVRCDSCDMWIHNECSFIAEWIHASCSNLGDNELLRIESGDGAWYCTNCKADCSLCSGVVLKGNKAVRCDSCDMWIHNECSFIAETQYETVNNTSCTWICPKREFFNFSNSFFGEEVNLETK